VWQQGEKTTIPGVVASEIIDPTGCGDAFRAAMLFGLERGWPLARCARLGNRLGALKIASRGGQNHVLDRTFAED
jgi:adenosine kinase